MNIGKEFMRNMSQRGWWWSKGHKDGWSMKVTRIYYEQVWNCQGNKLLNKMIQIILCNKGVQFIIFYTGLNCSDNLSNREIHFLTIIQTFHISLPWFPGDLVKLYSSLSVCFWQFPNKNGDLKLVWMNQFVFEYLEE